MTLKQEETWKAWKAYLQRQTNDLRARELLAAMIWHEQEVEKFHASERKLEAQ